MLRYALRLLLKSPGFTAIAVVTLALGIGANTAIFSIVNGLLLRDLPLHDSSRLVFVSVSSPQRIAGNGPLSVGTYELLRDRNQSFAGVAAYSGESFTLTGIGDPAQLTGSRISPNFLDVLGTQPLLGRNFTAAEGEPGGKLVVLISNGLWQNRFASDPNILGKPVTLSGNSYTIVGVMPPRFEFPFNNIEVWLTQIATYGGLRPEQIRNGAGYLLGIGRLKPGATVSAADAEATVIFKQYIRENSNGRPDGDSRARLDVVPLQESLVTGIRPTLLILSGAVGLVLLIACANVASLMMARATGRAREIAIRAALGAGRGVIIRQLLAESVMLSIAGALGGVLLAQWIVPIVAAAPGAALPNVEPIRVDISVLAFTIALSLLTGILFGLMPALQASRPDLNGVLRDGGWGSTAGGRRPRARSLLVAGQMALSIVLLIGAGLLVESFRQLQAVRPGFDPHNVLTMTLSLPPARYPNDARRIELLKNVLGRFESIPGVSAASASLGLPMTPGALAPFLADGQPVVPLGQRPLGEWKAITPDYFQTAGIPLVSGRPFTWSDDENAPRRIIVSQSLARRYFGNDNPIGKRITYAARQVAAEIVGVAGDVKARSLDADPGIVFYTPYSQFTWPNVAIEIRTAGDPNSIVNAARAQVLAADRDMPVINVRTLQEYVDNTLSQRREIMYVIAGFAVLALLLAVIGLYGVMAYSVAQRTTEIGIRQAIGASRSDILRLVLRQGVQLSLAGIAAGAVAAAFATRVITKMLFHVRATDPLTFAGISLIFLVVALAASYIPAYRATKIDPLVALRYR